MRLTRGGPLQLGVNYRLAYGWDFGDNDLSLANPARLATVNADFAAIATHNATILRWFVLNDGRGVMDRSGPKHWNSAALRAGLDAAQQHGLSVLLVLLDHTFCFREEQAGDSVKQGHGLWFKDASLFDRLLGQLLEPLIMEVGTHPAVLGFELLNEPEMAMRRRAWWFGKVTGVGSSLVPKEWQLSVGEMRARMSLVADAAHRTGKQFSVGSMSSRWVGQWEPVVDPDRDFLNFHYYGENHERDLDAMIESRILPIAERVAIGFGEFYPRGCDCIPPGRTATPWPDHRLMDFFSAARRYGLQLAMPWVWNPGENDPGEIPLDEWERYLRAD
ncbi:MAG: hypothetical protein HYX27_01555 [Acidobacteria bacterium]|nr:hypothetical protein [Acidobacteriota bacterium]